MSRSRALVLLGALIAIIAICDRVAVRSSIHEGHEALRLGITMYRQHRYEDAVQDFDRAEELLHAASDRARAKFNSGNASVAQGQLHDGLEAYEAALRLDPSDEDARYNLALVMQLQSERPKGGSSRSRDNPEELPGSPGQPNVRGHGRLVDK